MVFAGERVIRRRQERTGEDRYGDPIYAEVDTTLKEFAAFDPGGTREPVEVGREQTVTEPKLYFPRQWPDLVTTDQVIVRGVVFDIEGIPSDWRSPFSGSDVGGLVVELRRAEG